jgi:hypothetical protein
MGSVSIPEVDVLLVGAGFGAFTMLNKYVPLVLNRIGVDRDTDFGS